MRFLLVMAAPVVLLTLELLFRLLGLPGPSAGDSFYGQEPSGRIYQLGRLADGTEAYVASDASWNIKPAAFSRVKPPTTLRIAVLGGSSAAGFPFSREFSFCEWLRSGLAAVYPDRQIEILYWRLCRIAELQRAISILVAQHQLLVVQRSAFELTQRLQVAAVFRNRAFGQGNRSSLGGCFR